MKAKIILFRKSLKLVWESAPGWATVNILISVLQSFLPLILVYLIRILIDDITRAASSGDEITSANIIWMIAAVVIVYFLDEVSSDLGNLVRQKQSVKLEGYMYGLLHSKAVRLDLINFEHPGYFDILSRATAEAPWRPNSILDNIISMFRGFLSLVLMTALIVTLHWGLALLLLAVNVPGIWLRLHYADILYNFKREQIMPLNKSNPLEDLSEAIRYFHQKTGIRISYEYLLLKDFNDTLKDARQFAEFCKISPCKINLIEYNVVADSPFKRSDPDRTRAFKEFLESRNLVVNLRKSRGADIDAACGQLAGKTI